MCAERRACDSGFTLLEVVVALAIAGLALVGLFRAGSGGLFAVDAATRAEEAVQRAQSHLAALGHNAALTEGEFTGDDGGGYRWRLRVKPVNSRQELGQDGTTSAATHAIRCRGRNLMAGKRRRAIGSVENLASRGGGSGGRGLDG